MSASTPATRLAAGLRVRARAGDSYLEAAADELERLQILVSRRGAQLAALSTTLLIAVEDAEVDNEVSQEDRVHFRFERRTVDAEGGRAP